MAAKAILLARGLGKRMRFDSASAHLSKEQSDIASLGIKALMPITPDKTFLDFILSNIRNAGFEEICLVIGDEHQILKDFCAKNEISFAIQKEALGTSDAVLAAEDFAGRDSFVVLNSDNLYPVEALKMLRDSVPPSIVAFDKDCLVKESNIEAEKIRSFAILELDQDDFLKKIIEKPESDMDGFVSMNAWHFTPGIFEACRKIRPSIRGEYEITAAAQYAIDNLGARFKALKFRGGVLDLSSRDDIESVARKLQSIAGVSSPET